MFRKLFATIFFKVYKRYLHDLFQESFDEDMSYYPLYLRDEERIMSQGWHSELHTILNRAKTIEELAAIEAKWSENFDEDALPRILYKLDEWLKGDREENV